MLLLRLFSGLSSEVVRYWQRYVSQSIQVNRYFDKQEDPDEMLHKAAKIKKERIHHNLEILTCYPLNPIVDYTMLIVSICLGKSIRMKRARSQPRNNAIG